MDAVRALPAASGALLAVWAAEEIQGRIDGVCRTKRSISEVGTSGITCSTVQVRHWTAHTLKWAVRLWQFRR